MSKKTPFLESDPRTQGNAIVVRESPHGRPDIFVSHRRDDGLIMNRTNIKSRSPDGEG